MHCIACRATDNIAQNSEQETREKEARRRNPRRSEKCCYDTEGEKKIESSRCCGGNMNTLRYMARMRMGRSSTKKTWKKGYAPQVEVR